MTFSEIGRILLIAGAVVAAVGLFMILGEKIPFLGRLPGDIHIVKRNFTFHFPIVTCIVLSIIITLIFNFFLRK